MTAPLSGIEAVEREAVEAAEKMRRPDTTYLVGGLMLDSWAARLKAERERLEPFLKAVGLSEKAIELAALGAPLGLNDRATMTGLLYAYCAYRAMKGV